MESAQPERCEHNNTDGSSEGCAYDRRDSVVCASADRPGWAWALRRMRRRRRRRQGAGRRPFEGRWWRGVRRWRWEGARRRRRPRRLRRRPWRLRWPRRREGARRKARRLPRRRWLARRLRWGRRRQRARRKARWLPRWRWCSRRCGRTYDGGNQEPARTKHRVNKRALGVGAGLGRVAHETECLNQGHRRLHAGGRFQRTTSASGSNLPLRAADRPEFKGAVKRIHVRPVRARVARAKARARPWLQRARLPPLRAAYTSAATPHWSSAPIRASVPARCRTRCCNCGSEGCDASRHFPSSSCTPTSRRQGG